METEIIKIAADHQSGKTTLAASIVIGARSRGIGAFYIAPTSDRAVHAVKFLGIPAIATLVWFCPNSGMSELIRCDATLVVLDDLSRFQFLHEGHPIDIIKSWWAGRSTPRQIVAFY